jgi:citronellol/citronellal dehydrogenase
MGVLLADAGSAPARAVGEVCESLGARVVRSRLDAAARADEEAMDALIDAAGAAQGGIELVVVDGAGMFAAAASEDEGDGVAALRGCLQGSWNATRAAVNRVLLPQAGGGRLVLIAPAAGAGEHAGAARAGIENLARTLSVEWARHGLTAVAVGADEDTAAHELAAIVAYIGSPAGAYLSGCLLELR